MSGRLYFNCAPPQQWACCIFFSSQRSGVKEKLVFQKQTSNGVKKIITSKGTTIRARRPPSVVPHLSTGTTIRLRSPTPTNNNNSSINFFFPSLLFVSLPVSNFRVAIAFSRARRRSVLLDDDVTNTVSTHPSRDIFRGIKIAVEDFLGFAVEWNNSEYCVNMKCQMSRILLLQYTKIPISSCGEENLHEASLRKMAMRIALSILPPHRATKKSSPHKRRKPWP